MPLPKRSNECLGTACIGFCSTKPRDEAFVELAFCSLNKIESFRVEESFKLQRDTKLHAKLDYWDMVARLVSLSVTFCLCRQSESWAELVSVPLYLLRLV